MIAFNEMLVRPAKDAGINVPLNINDYKPVDFPHWHVFCALQLGISMPYPTAHFDNAKVIAEIGVQEIVTITIEEIKALGFTYGMPIP